MVEDSLLYKNPFRVTLTELLPYEVILGFDTTHFFKNLNDNVFSKIVQSKKYVPGNKLAQFKIPFDYHIRRSGGEKSRKLSLMHMDSQLQFVDFYNEYAEFILYYTSLSPISLRHPSKKAKTCFIKHAVATDDLPTDPGDSIEIDEDLTDTTETKYKNYFAYRKYGLLYKFFDSFEFLNLEKKFSKMRHLDVASCFYHIYTHSISWAVKDKPSAKKIHMAKEVFENRFDSLMSESNYGETNGILVGPEISRIFAEIIFQRIDILILHGIKNQFPNVIQGKDYEIRRYIDDYYVFSNSMQLLDDIQTILTDIIEEYKLFLNKSKIENIDRPMVGSNQVAKAEIKNIFTSTFSKWETSNYNIANVNKATHDLINSIRLCIGSSTAKYSDISSYGLTIINNFINNKARDYFKDPSHPLNSTVFTVLIETAYFLFSMDWCVTSSYKICQMGYLMHEICKDDKKVSASISHKTVMEAKRCLDIMAQNRLKDCTNIESMNLLISLKNIFHHSFSENTLRKYFDLENDPTNKDLDYFQVCALLFLCGNDPAYHTLKNDVQSIVERKYTNYPKEEIGNNAELTYLLLDTMTCPYVDVTVKNKIISSMGFSSGKIGSIRDELASPGLWFFDWNNATDFQTYLKKKEFNRPYD